MEAGFDTSKIPWRSNPSLPQNPAAPPSWHGGCTTKEYHQLEKNMCCIIQVEFLRLVIMNDYDI